MRSYCNRQNEDQSETTEGMGVLSSCRLASRTTKTSMDPSNGSYALYTIMCRRRRSAIVQEVISVELSVVVHSDDGIRI